MHTIALISEYVIKIDSQITDHLSGVFLTLCVLYECVDNNFRQDGNPQIQMDTLLSAPPFVEQA